MKMCSGLEDNVMHSELRSQQALFHVPLKKVCLPVIMAAFIIVNTVSTDTDWVTVWIFLTLSPPIPLRLYTFPYWSNPPFLIFDSRGL